MANLFTRSISMLTTIWKPLIKFNNFSTISKPMLNISKFPTLNNNFNIAIQNANINCIQIRGKKYRVVQDDVMDAHRVLRFSKTDGLRTQADIVLKRFFRLDWGCWIRAKRGRNFKLHKKNAHRQRRLRQHVMCNANQSHMLDKMVLRDIRRKHNFVDDPYKPYHTREYFLYTRKQPLPLSKNAEQFLDNVVTIEGK